MLASQFCRPWRHTSPCIRPLPAKGSMNSASGARTVHTVGHSTRTLSELTALLSEAGVQVIADVRSVPRSRRNPQFNIDLLPASLADSAMRYQHFAELGGRRHRPRDAPPSPNTFWRNDSFRNYADYAMTDEFATGMARLHDLVVESNCAIMCSEALWWRCHRRIISDYLLSQDFAVLHIMGPRQIETATMTPGANRLPDGTLVYPVLNGRLSC
jgi:uncharacterized protein (DUF488 family)